MRTVPQPRTGSGKIAIAVTIVCATRYHLKSRMQRFLSLYYPSAEITTPSGQKVHPKIADNKDGTVSVFFSPTEIGLHHLNVTYNGIPIEGSPFQFFVGNPSPGHVTASGPGLSHGVVGKPCDFIINTKDAGDGT